MISMQFSTRKQDSSISYPFDFCIACNCYMKDFAKIFITLTEVPLFLVRSKSNDKRTISLVPLDLDKYAVKIEKNKKKMNHINYY